VRSAFLAKKSMTAVTSLLIAIAAVMSENQPAPEPTDQDAGAEDESLTIEEAAALLRRSTKWMYRHRDRLPFVKKIGPRSYLVSRPSLNRWLACRQ